MTKKDQNYNIGDIIVTNRNDPTNLKYLGESSFANRHPRRILVECTLCQHQFEAVLPFILAGKVQSCNSDECKRFFKFNFEKFCEGDQVSPLFTYVAEDTSRTKKTLGKGFRRYLFVKCLCGEVISRRSDQLKYACRKCNAKERRSKNKLSQEQNVRSHLYGVYRRQALKRGFVFELTKTEFLSFLCQPCHYCNSEPSNTKTERHISVKYNGIDRLDSSVGYVFDNCVPCCHLCNDMKGTLSKSNFLDQVNKINRFQSKMPR